MTLTLYPVALAIAVTLTVAGVCYGFGNERWASVVAGVGLLQAVGLVFVSRAMFYTAQLLPQQLLFATAAIAITTKFVVFAPGMLVSVADPTSSISISRQDFFIGLAGAWLIQTSLALLFLFPQNVIGQAIMWVMPFSPVSAFAPLFAVGVVVVQVTIASSVFDPEAAAASEADVDVETDASTDVDAETPRSTSARTQDAHSRMDDVADPNPSRGDD